VLLTVTKLWAYIFSGQMCHIITIFENKREYFGQSVTEIGKKDINTYNFLEEFERPIF
jgi:hypothetical protein